MKVRYVNTQDKSDPMNGAVIFDANKLTELIDARRNRNPFIADLIADNGFELMIGIGGSVGCAQYSRSDGEPPYLMAASRQRPVKRGVIEFYTNDTPTPFAARYIIGFDELKEVAVHFLRTGERSDAVSWHVFDPGAAREDARTEAATKLHK